MTENQYLVLMITVIALTLVLLVAILAVSNRRMAADLREAREYIAWWATTQVKSLRSDRTKEIDELDLGAWAARLYGEAAQGLVIQAIEGEPALQAVDMKAENGTRLVLSALPPRRLRRELGANGRSGKAPSALLASSQKALLGAHPRRVEGQVRGLLHDPWFDLAAARLGVENRVPWGEPEELWFYLVPSAAESG